MTTLEAPAGEPRRPRVAVGMVLWNSARWVDACLGALAHQCPAGDMELVVVDNGSRDGGLDRVRARWPGAAVIPNSKNRGFAAAQNQAIAVTVAPFFLALNPDVVLEPGYVRLLCEALEADPRAASATGVLLRPGGGVDTAGLMPILRKRLFVDIEAEPPPGAATEVFGACAAAALYRRAALLHTRQRGQIFDEDFFAYVEDVDLAWRLRRAGWTALVVPGARGLHARGAEEPRNVARVRALSTRNRYLMLLKNEPGVSRELLRALGRDLLRLARQCVTEPSALWRLPTLLWLAPRALAKRRGLPAPAAPPPEAARGLARAPAPVSSAAATPPARAGGPAVSAIVVTHDSPPGALLAACGSFAAAFTGVERETIVADNGSRVPFFPAGAFAVRIGGNLGFGAACNRAAAVARAPVLLFLNPDARLAAGRWEAILERFEADPLLGAVGVLRREPDGGEAPEVVPPAMTPRQVCRDLLFAGGGRRRRPPVEGGGFQPVAWLPASCLFVRARLFVELGGFDELFFLYFEDVDLCERIRRTGYTVAFTPAAEAVHPEGGHEKYHDRARLGHYYAGLAAYLAKWHSRSAPLLAGVILLRLASRAAFWSVARLLGRIDRTAWSERMAGYAAAARAVLRSRPRAKEETA